MNRTREGGYTIIEALIFLTVSAAIMVSTITLINGRQERIRYTQSVNTFNQSLKDIFNDVSTGYYANAGDVRCTAVGSEILISQGAQELGTNSACIFLGKTIQLGNGTDRSAVNSYTMVGSRKATNLGDSRLKLLGVGNQGIVDNRRTEADLDIVRLVSTGVPARTVNGIAMVSQFSNTNEVNNTVTGNGSKLDIYDVTGSIDSSFSSSSLQAMSQSTLICLQQGGSNGRKATIKVNNNLSTEVTIDRWLPECGV